MLKWWKRRKAKTDAKRDYGNMVALYAEIKSVKRKLDDLIWVMETYHADLLPTQTQQFAIDTEFKFTSLISCYGMALDKWKAQLIKEKLLNEQKAQQITAG